MGNIPFILVSGFLGSGKTTLLIRLLREIHNRQLSPGILMNELGTADVDGVLLEEETGASIERLLDGCVCCSKKEELAQSLVALLDKQPDLIVAELTGVANPVEVVSLLHSHSFANKIRLSQVITVLDAEHALDYASRFSADKQLVTTLRAQLEAASLVLLNKADLTTPSKLRKLEQLVHKSNPRALLTVTEHAVINAKSLLDDILLADLPADGVQTRPGNGRAKPGTVKLTGKATLKPDKSPAEQTGGFAAVMNSDFTRAAAAEPGDAGAVSSPDRKPGSPASFSGVVTFTLTCPFPAALTRDQVEGFIRETPGEIMRAKGYLSIEGQGSQLVQMAGGRITWQASRYPGSGYLVLIGLALDQTEIRQRWDALFPTGSRSSVLLP